jgi:hypothetical protein
MGGRDEELNLDVLPQRVCRTGRARFVGLVLPHLSELDGARTTADSQQWVMPTPVRPNGLRPARLPPHKKVLLLVDFINPLDFPGGQELAPAAVEAARACADLKKRLAGKE